MTELEAADLIGSIVRKYREMNICILKNIPEICFHDYSKFHQFDGRHHTCLHRTIKTKQTPAFKFLFKEHSLE